MFWCCITARRCKLVYLHAKRHMTRLSFSCSQQAAELLNKLTEDRTWQSQSPHYGTKAARDLLDAAQKQLPVSLPSITLPSIKADSLKLPSDKLPSSVHFPSFSAPSFQLPDLGKAEDLQDAAARISKASLLSSCNPKLHCPLPQLVHRCNYTL